MLRQMTDWRQQALTGEDGRALAPGGTSDYRQMNLLCRNVTSASQYSRVFEIVVQAKWVEYFKHRVDTLAPDSQPPSSSMKAAIVEACQDFGWTEKELRNRM